MPWVVDPVHGRLIVTAHGNRHTIRCGADPISQRAVITDDVEKVKNARGGKGEKASFKGTEVRLEWSPRSDDDGVFWPFGLLSLDPEYGFPERFRELVTGFAVFNPHATIRLDWFGTLTTWEATDPKWAKWRPCQPTSPHWYEGQHLERLIGAYLTHDRDAGTDRLVSDFIDGFDGLTGSAKRTKVLDRAGLKRAKLSELVSGDRLDADRVAALLAAMQRHTRPVNPKRLGIIGEEHLKARLLAMGVV